MGADDPTLKITFVLPGTGRVPIGGYKVVYEYANHLSRKGHMVTVVHPARGCSQQMHLSDYAKNAFRYFEISLGRAFRPDAWFQIDPNVKLLCVPGLSGRWIPEGDIIIATAWFTAQWAKTYSCTKGKRFYLIQHLETWDGNEEEVLATWKAPLQKIVISQWLLKIANNLGEKAVYIANGLSADEFQIDIRPEERASNSIMMLYHESSWKGTADGLEALFIARMQNPKLSIALFGTSKRPELLPKWIEYYYRPERPLLRSLYNQAAIFVAPSLTEGWGLPPSEAMLCGAAVVATDIGGHREFAFHNQTSLLSPAKDPQRMADNILHLINDSETRVRIAKCGNEYIQQFTWKRASEKFEEVICGP